MFDVESFNSHKEKKTFCYYYYFGKCRLVFIIKENISCNFDFVQTNEKEMY